MERFRDDLFAHAGPVDVRGVDSASRRAPTARRTHANAFFAVGDDAHRTETEAAHLELAAEHECRIHSCIDAPPASAER